MEKERLEKVNKAIDVGIKLSYALGELDCSVKGSQEYHDLFFVSRLLNAEWRSLWADLYPKDLMEDLKIRLKKYHEAKAEIGWPSGNVKMGFMARIKRFIK